MNGREKDRMRGLYVLTDRESSGTDHVTAVGRLLEAGVRWIQLREKNRSRKVIYETALVLRELTRRAGARLIVNDHLDIAMAVGADGVHLGQDDLPLAAARRIAPTGFIIGISTHDRDQALAAERGGADYIGFGPLFATSTKEAGIPRGIESLREVRAAVGIPIAAIGGITVDTAPAVVRAGADLVAVASAVYSEADWGPVVKKFQGIMAGESGFSPRVP